jgi:aryl-alcohol dehydrogenase-like predicted oxidoreductase
VAGERIAELVRCAARTLHRPISNQPLYNLFDRGIEAEVLPVSARMASASSSTRRSRRAC